MSNHPSIKSWQSFCPIEVPDGSEVITLAHGEGGRLSRKLIREHVLPILGNDSLHSLNDATSFQSGGHRMAMTTDSFVVSPLFFPGGDIGTLAVNGTVNDLAVAGALPQFISLALMIEEGFPVAVLDEILQRIKTAADAARVEVITGDTKVLPRGAVDGLFINTTGVGSLQDPVPVGPSALVPDAELLVSGPIAKHGLAVLCAREDLQLEPSPESDCASLYPAAELLRNELGSDLIAMRDATRGGVAAVLFEWAEASGLTMALTESKLPVTSAVRGASELLGLDPLHVANEGTMVIAVAKGASARALAALQSIPQFGQAAVIGTAHQPSISPVTILRTLGSEQPLDEPIGAPLPRIC